MEQPQAGNYLWGCVFSPRDPRAKRLKNPLRIPLQTPTEPQLTWFFVAMGNTQGSRGFVFGRLIGKQARNRKWIELTTVVWGSLSGIRKLVRCSAPLGLQTPLLRAADGLGV